MDILNHSLPQLYMGHYFKYLLLRYHSFVHFRQTNSKSYSMRLFEKKHSPSPASSYCVTFQFASFAAQIRVFSLWQLSEIDQKTWAQT